ncbi:hypothetical protein VTO58DRAFT_109675 [Aureobasidium pullulans]|nr:hypothetical protein JADG_001571 [Aureobasidium pullulans]KAG2161835.1 hypothetical protein JADG_001574 [Aureobasidium pullulans]
MSSQDPIPQLLKAMAALQESAEHSDLTITCGSDVYKVHKAIVCSQSEFFRLACRKRNGSEANSKGDFKEAQTSTVEIPHSNDIESTDDGWDMDAEDPKSVKFMIHYLYHMDSLEDETAKIKAQPAAAFLKDNDLKDGILIDHAKMYAMGDKYGIPGLKSLARTKFNEVLQYTGAGLVKAMRIAYTSTIDSDKDLRLVIVDKLHSSMPTCLNSPEVDRAIKELPELAHALLRKVHRLSY